MSTKQLVSLPISRAQLAQIAAGEPLADSTGFVLNAGLAETFELDIVKDAEAGEYAAFLLAGLAALLQYGERLVAVAELGIEQFGAAVDEANGCYQVRQVRPKQVTAFFSEEAGFCAPTIPAGISLDEAWDLPQVQALFEQNPMLWHDVSELAWFCASQNRKAE